MKTLLVYMDIHLWEWDTDARAVELLLYVLMHVEVSIPVVLAFYPRAH